jgi:hypothetical protein
MLYDPGTGQCAGFTGFKQQRRMGACTSDSRNIDCQCLGYLIFLVSNVICDAFE